MRKEILGLDPGQTTGWATVEQDGDDLRVTGYGEIPVFGPTIDDLLEATEQWLDVRALSADEVVFEGPLNIYGSMTRTELHEVRSVIRMWCIRNNKLHADYHPAAVKKAVTGNGRAKKGDVAAVVREVFNLPRLPTDHASDALAIILTHVGVTNGTFDNTGTLARLRSGEPTLPAAQAAEPAPRKKGRPRGGGGSRGGGNRGTAAKRKK